MATNTMKRYPAIVSIAIFAFVLAGCGGSTPESYTLEGSKECLSGLGHTTPKEDMNDLAFDAPDAVGVAAGDNNVEIGFERTENDAKRNLSRLKLVGEALGGPVNDVLSRQGNVVILWENTPTSAQAAGVKDCLS